MNGIKGLKIGGLKAPTPPKVPGVISPTVNNTASPSKVGSQSVVVKTPKSKAMPEAGDKPSLFSKSEGFKNIKKPSIENLRSFLESQRAKRRN